jgi:hypothetical protein
MLTPKVRLAIDPEALRKKKAHRIPKAFLFNWFQSFSRVLSFKYPLPDEIETIKVDR